MVRIRQIDSIPHKILFYLGFLIVILFLGLAYWQFSRYREDVTTINEINAKSTNLPTNILVDDLYGPCDVDDLYGPCGTTVNEIAQYSYVRIKYRSNLENINLINSWYLRSRVHNGESGYNFVSLYTVSSNDKYFIVNHGWVPLDFDKDSIDHNQINRFFEGRLVQYDTQGVGQDDIFGSDYIFRIDKNFIEREFSIEYPNIQLPDYYIVLTDYCILECINIIKPYDAPHLSYAFQWLFFGIVLSVVILRKNKLI